MRINHSELAGQKFGLLEPIHIVRQIKSHKIWFCKCDCGNTKEVFATNLIRGHSRSCGCINDKRRRSKRMDITGQKFDKFTVVSFAYERKGHKYWNCICDCGTECVVEGGNLRSRESNSCGCNENMGRLSNQENRCYNKVLSQYKTGAKKRGIEWHMSESHFRKLIKQNCHYCDSPPSNKNKIYRSEEKFVYSGIDRIDGGHYTDFNTVTCCALCNWAKSDQLDYEYIDHCRKVVYYQDSKKFDLLSLIKDPSLVQELAYGT